MLRFGPERRLRWLSEEEKVEFFKQPPSEKELPHLAFGREREDHS
jgi:hypothetical protein